ncbi:FCGBP protein, partial [Sula dactylatra]|nr:FCGBP protein [Sula dactylatra]
VIDLPSSYYKHTCGLCGNFNLKPEDDVPKSGSDLEAVVAWAKGWKSPDDDDPFCWDYCKENCPVCDPDLGMVVCKEAGCKLGEKCAMVNGVRRCVAKSRSICVASGDPHYSTFDGRLYDFMGTCVYQLAALCSDDPTLVPFSVTVENNNRGSRVVSYTKEVTLKVYNMTLSLSQEHPQKLKVNGILVDLPFSHANKLQVYLSGVHGFIKTDFEVIVTFDWYSYVRVILPDTYSRAVCGLCGNADGDPQNDLTLPNGQLATDEIQFADSWKVADVPGCWAGCTEGCQVCTEAEKRAYRGDKHCGLLVKKQGPFAACHGAIDPNPYFNNCLFDTCLYEGHQETVCHSISAYVAACQSQGINIMQWRSDAFCSPVCPPNQHYELCGPACPATCWGQAEVEACDEAAPCTEGCFCNEGFLRSGDRCVPLTECGCLHEGRYYKMGEEFFACPHCSERCACKGAGAVECRPEGCAAGEECMVQDGVRGCYPRECGLCQVLGAVSYSTFDGRLMHFAGTCTYTLAAAEATSLEDPLVPFVVEVEKESGEVGPAIRQLLVAVHGVTVGMARGTQWTVTVSGAALGCENRFGVQSPVCKLLFSLQMPFWGAGHGACTPLCGANPAPGCGAAHANPAPGCKPCFGLQIPARKPSFSMQTLLWGANLALGCTAGCANPALGCNPCFGVQSRMCKPCFGVQPLLWGATLALGCKAGCASPALGCNPYFGVQPLLWGAQQDVQTPLWALSCPANSHYELCTHTCDHTCASLSASTQCTTKCFEGCQCDEGFLFNGEECVLMDSCGCLHHGRYFEIAETILSSDCSESCTCQAAGGMQCQPAGCPFGQACGLKDGVRACVEQPGRCTLSPNTRFVSFDGTIGTTMATGIYVVTTLCDPHHSASSRLLADVGENQDRPAVMALHLFGPQAFITVKRDKRVWVNGVPAALPVEVSSTLTITETRGTIWITQQPELVIGLSPAGEVTVTVTRDLSKQLCGICGDYDGNAANDLRGPDGKLVGNVAALMKAWRAPDF